MSDAGWFMVGARGSSRDLWVDVTGPDAPRYGRWVTPAGLDVARVLDADGPPALDVPVWWEQSREHYGKRPTDLLWQTGMSGLKLASTRMVQVLRDAGGIVSTFDVDVRWRRGGQVEGYVGMHEQTSQAGPVHSLWRGRRTHRFVVSSDVRAALEEAALVGLEYEPVPGPFPADLPGFFEE